MFKNPTTAIWITSAIGLGLAAGCDERLADVAREAADRQAEQNATMAELHQQVARGTRSLVDADAEARRGIVGLHHDLQAERRRLDAGWSALETQRQQLARQRHTESGLVAIMKLTGGLTVVIVVVGFLWQVLVHLRTSDLDGDLSELLIDEITSERPRLLTAHPSRRRPAHDGESPTADASSRLAGCEP